MIGSGLKLESLGTQVALGSSV